MEMIDVLKRLAALDANNPNVETTMLPEQNLATITNTGAEPADLNECGPMGMGAPMPNHTPASINMTANSGEELSSMLRDIMSLAGVKSGSSEPGREIEIGAPHAVDFDPNADMAAAISKIDKLNGADDEEENEGMLGALGGAAVGGMAAGPLGALTGAAAGDSLTDPDGDEDDEEENEGVLGTGVGAGLGSILGGPVGAAAGGIAGDAMSDKSDSKEKESWDNSPDQEIEPHDYGDKQVTPKPQGFKQRMGDNPYKMTDESIDAIASRLLSEFQAFKNG